MRVEMLVLQGGMALLATVGFAVLFNVPPRLLAACGVVGIGGHLVRYGLLQNGASPTLAAYIGALFVGLFGYGNLDALQAAALGLHCDGHHHDDTGHSCLRSAALFLRRRYQRRLISRRLRRADHRRGRGRAQHGAPADR
jgi:hypothetical protein